MDSFNRFIRSTEALPYLYQYFFGGRSRNTPGRFSEHLGMVWIDMQVGKQQRLLARFLASAIWFNRDKNSINLSQRFRICEPQNPSLLRRVVHIEDAKIERLLPVRSTSAPGLESASILDTSLLVQIVGVKDQRFPFRVEHAAVGFPRLSGTLDVIHFRNVEISGPHQVTDVAVVGQQLLLLVERGFTIVEQTSEITDLCLKRSGPLLVLG